MNKLNYNVLAAIALAGQGNTNVAVSKQQYRPKLGEYGEVDLALAILWLHEQGYIVKTSASSLGTVCLTKAGKQSLDRAAQDSSP